MAVNTFLRFIIIITKKVQNCESTTYYGYPNKESNFQKILDIIIKIIGAPVPE